MATTALVEMATSVSLVMVSWDCMYFIWVSLSFLMYSGTPAESL